MDHRPEDQASATSEVTRGILLTPRGGAEPLVNDAIGARGWTITTLDDPVMAMSELCLLERSQAARAAWGLRGTADLVLIVSGEAMPDDLVAAVQWYLPDVVIWRYDDAAITMLDGEPEANASADASPASSNAPPAEVSAAEIDMLFGSAQPESTA